MPKTCLANAKQVFDCQITSEFSRNHLDTVLFGTLWYNKVQRQFRTRLLARSQLFYEFVSMEASVDP